MVSDIEALQEATRYKIEKQKYSYDDSYRELEFSRGRKNYDRLVKRLMNIELPPYLTLTYSQITLDELKEYLNKILIKVLGPDFEEQILDLCQKITLIRTDDYFDTLVRIKDDKPKEILVPKQLHSIEVASTANGFVRFMMTKYEQEKLNKVISNYHYKDLLSIAIEYIVCYELSKYFKQDKLNDKHDIIRTQAVYLNQKEHESVEKMEMFIRSKSMAKYRELKAYFEFEPHVSYANTICDIHSNRMLDLYRAGEQRLLELIRNIILGKNSIEDLLKAYNITLTDEYTIDSYERRLTYLKDKYSKK